MVAPAKRAEHFSGVGAKYLLHWLCWRGVVNWIIRGNAAQCLRRDIFKI